MKKHLTLYMILLQGCFAMLTAQDWDWKKGDKATDQYGLYGTLGTPGASNKPGARSMAGQWTDVNGNLWLFGGEGFAESGSKGYLNDLWKFDTTSSNWVWMGGAKTTNAHGAYGVKGVPASGNSPGARYGSLSWTDPSGKFWLYGGSGWAESGAAGSLNDLWRYDPGTGLWTWISGDKTIDQNGVYGVKGVPDPLNKPGGRRLAGNWMDRNGNLWLFGGMGLPESGGEGLLTDLWKFDRTTLLWSWEGGLKTTDVVGSYGVQGMPSVSNHPGSRKSPMTWVDEENDLWLMGGSGYPMSGASGYLNDLWKFDRTVNQWIWVGGSKIINQPGVYGVLNQSDENNQPGGREAGAVWVDKTGRFWLFGGLGYAAGAAQGSLSDLWSYDVQTNEWTWVKGNASVDNVSVFGTQGVPDPITTPGGRLNPMVWHTSFGQLWMLGGIGFGEFGFGSLNDLFVINVFQFSYIFLGITANDLDPLNWFPGLPPIAGGEIVMAPDCPADDPQKKVWTMTRDYTMDYLRMNKCARTNLNGFKLTITRGLMGRGLFIGSPTSRLELKNIGMCYLRFDKSQQGFSNALLELTVHNSRVRMSHPRMHLPNDSGYNPLQIYGTWTVKFVGGVMDLNHQHVTLRSTPTQTATYTQTLGGRLEEADTVTVERYLPAGSRWTLLTVPVVGLSVNSAWQNGCYIPQKKDTSLPGRGILINGFRTLNAANANANGFDFWEAIANAGSSICYYQQGEKVGRWMPVSNTKEAKFDDRQAYLLFKRASRDKGAPPPAGATLFYPTGTMVTGNVGVSVNPRMSHTLIGNPYPAVLDMEKVYNYSDNKDEIKPQIWVWDANKGSVGDYKLLKRVNGVWVDSDTKAATDLYLIQSGSAFFIEPKSKTVPPFFFDMAEINKTDSAIIPPNRLLQPAALQDRFTLALRRTGPNGTPVYLDGVEAQFADRFNVGVTDEEDAVRPFLFSENMSIRRGDNPLKVDARPPVTSADTLQLQFNEIGQGNYSFHFQSENLDQTALKAWLYDAHQGKKYSLPLDGRADSISFTITTDLGSVNTDRFSIIMESADQKLKLGVLKAEQVNESIRLDWTVEHEKGKARYEIERSADGNVYTKIGDIAAASANRPSAIYSFVDASPLDGTGYYRIKSVEAGGRLSYSNKVKVMVVSRTMSINLYPNPLEGRVFYLSLKGMPSGTYAANLYAANGNLLQSRTIEHAGGSSQKEMELPGSMPAGTYYVRVLRDGEVLKNIKLVIR